VGGFVAISTRLAYPPIYRARLRELTLGALALAVVALVANPLLLLLGLLLGPFSLLPG